MARGPFHDLDEYLAMPRLSGLALSPAGDRLVTVVAELDPKGAKYVNALWEVDPTGDRPAHRLTRSAEGEHSPRFTSDGDLLFISARPDPAGEDDDEHPPALWSLPAAGGEARVVAARPGGIDGVLTAQRAPTSVVLAPTMPAAVTAADDAARRKARKEKKISAILHQTYPVRYWDHDLGPDEPRLLVVPPGGAEAAAHAAADAPDEGANEGDGEAANDGDPAELRDLTPQPARALDEAELDLSPDGTAVVTTWQQPERGGIRATLVLIDTATGDRRTLLDDPEWEYNDPRFAPDGARVALGLYRRPTAERPPRIILGVLDLATGELTEVAAGWDRWPRGPVWLPGSDALLVTADEDGATPVFRVDLATHEVTRLTGDHGAYTDLQVAPDGSAVYALRSAVDCPPLPVRLDPGTPNQQPTSLPAAMAAPELPGTLTEVHTTAGDGSPLRGWLALPHEASASAPVPLLLWVHGGPLMSWSGWTWRWNPWLAVAAGYAVLLPDPALSTGYGQAFVARGWGRWGAEPFTDLMELTDAAEGRADIDAGATAAMGGSFGGYMANWIAGHTDRFRGIVSHAGIWALDQFGPTTDAYHYWRREMTPEVAERNSPHRSVAQISTPLLVIHGDRDYRVPVGEGIRMWAELSAHASDEAGATPHKFLYFPDEHHWIMKPQQSKLWYETVFAFLAHTVHGKGWEPPELLR